MYFVFFSSKEREKERERERKMNEELTYYKT
jgi:hypothetical protein